MAKHRKTRQEKIIADQRHVIYHLDTTPAQVNSKHGKKSEFSLDLTPTKTQATTVSYNYVTKDLRKTTLLTSIILISQIFLFIVLNRI